MDITGLVHGMFAGFDLGSFLAGSVVAGLIGLVGAYLIKHLILSTAVIKYIAAHADEWIDAVQRKTPQIGKATRSQLVVLCDEVKKALLEADGTN